MAEMTTNEEDDRHIKFYGLHDLATSFQAAEAAELIANFDPEHTHHTLTTVIELHNARRYIEVGAIPVSYSANEREQLQQRIATAQRTIGTFFSQLDDTKLAELTGPLPYDYYSDLLELFERNKAYDRCTPAVAFSLADRLGLRLHDMLASREFVKFCSEDLRGRITADPSNAELVIRKHLEQSSQGNIYLPSSLSHDEAAALINQYIDSEDAHPNYLKLLYLARFTPEIGLDAKMRLKAKRRHDSLVHEFFANNSGMRTTCQVSISTEQQEPVDASSVNGDTKFSYSQTWLEDNLDYPTIMNNFIFLFEFVDNRGMLTLPSFASEIGPLERVMGMTAKHNYQTSTSFGFKDQVSSMQVEMYRSFLNDKGIELESVVTWFFATQIATEFGTEGFSFTPSSPTSTHLERCRHLFSEMESAAKQYKLYVENGEVDPELLSISSEPMQYKSLPSLLTGKYAYAADEPIGTILYLLFSDQSSLHYISEELNASSAAALIANNRLSYSDFNSYHHPELDFLVTHGVLARINDQVEFSSEDQVVALKHLHDYEAISYYHYPAATQAALDEMVERGWLVRGDTLLSQSEASYLNYMLNQTEFSNGPDLRNKYLHGSQVNASGDHEHFRTYVVVLKLLIALIIKINDDLCLRQDESDTAK